MMLSPPWQHLIHKLHQHPNQGVFEVAGAGMVALAWLHSAPNSSKTVLEATDRYAKASLTTLLGYTPERFVSSEVAHDLALKALARALFLRDTQTPCIGIGCSATIATTPPKRGKHRAHVAFADVFGTVTYSLTMTKGARSREKEEALVSMIMLHALAEGCALPPPALPLLVGEILEVTHTVAPIFHDLYTGDISSVYVDTQGGLSLTPPAEMVLFAGSFNPLHKGHVLLAEHIKTGIGKEVTFELSIENAAKASLSLHEMVRRARQFSGCAPLILSRAPLFSDKARLFPKSMFVVGADTAQRLLEPRFYQHSLAHMDQALAEVAHHRGMWLVADRVSSDDPTQLIRLADLSLPPEFQELFVAVPEFRLDLSSSQLRNQEHIPHAFLD